MSTELRSPLLDEVLVAHGGLGLWQRCERIDAHLSFGGLAFAARMKRKAYLDRVVAIFPHTRKVRLTPIPLKKSRG